MQPLSLPLSSLSVLLLLCSFATALPPVPKFDCPPLQPPPPAKDVRHLKPGNIKVVLAMGDSITAGFAMKGYPPADFLEYRDYVFSIGGAEGALTIPNFLKFYSPHLEGAASSWTFPLTKGYWLDAGVSMAKVKACPSQVEYLVKTMQSEYKDKINFEEDWKLLTLFIGANNICPSCENTSSSQPAHFEAELRKTLQLIEDKIPRVFVNLMTIFNISGVWTAGQTSEYCRFLWDGLTNNECGCLTSGNPRDREIMDEHSILFNQISNKLAKEFAAKNNPNFTVVVQPGVSGLNIGELGEDVLSDLDCFHPNEYANMGFSIAIWNNMFTPPGKKATNIVPDKLHIKCPDADSFIQ